MKTTRRLLTTLCFFTAVGTSAVGLKPVVIPLALPVCNAYALPSRSCVGIEISISSFERQFATVYITNNTSISVDTVPLDEYKGGTKAVLGTWGGANLVLLQASEIAILNRENNTITDEYPALLPRPDAQPEYFQGKMTGESRLRVITEMQPSFDADGVFDPTMHSLVYDDVVERKTIRRIGLSHPLGEFPPVFFGSHEIIYRNKRKDNAEPWKAVDNTLTATDHPLCALLDRTLSSAFVWSLALSDQFTRAVVFSTDVRTNRPSLLCANWRTGKVLPVFAGTGVIADVKNLMISPSGKWAFFTATTESENSRSVVHEVFALDPGLPSDFLRPHIIAPARKDDHVAWITDPEGVAIFGGGKMSVLNLSKRGSRPSPARHRHKTRRRKRT